MLPVYGSQRSTPLALLRTGRIHTEWEQHGVFRIGALPRVIIEEVTLELQPNPDPAAVLERLRELATRRRFDRSPVELRRFALRAGTNAPPLLEAAVVRLDRNGTRLSQVVLRRPGVEVLTCGQARLTFGADARFWLEAPTHRYPLDWPEPASDRLETSIRSTTTHSPL